MRSESAFEVVLLTVAYSLALSCWLTGDLIWRAGWVGLGTAPGGNRWQKANRMCSIGPVPLLKA